MSSELETINLKLGELATAANINELLTDEQSGAVGRKCLEGYQNDRMSRYQWERQMRDAFTLALQIQEEKTFPWEGASNIKHPLITIATLQWASRAYSGLIKAPDIVRCRVVGEDGDGKKAARAVRVSEHMNYQLIEQDEPWEEEHDKLLMTLPIIGSTFIKTTNTVPGNYPKGEHVLSSDLVMDYNARSVASCRRKTHRFNMWGNEIREKVLMGYFTDNDLGDRANEPDFYDPTKSLADKRQGLSKTTEEGPRLTLEQHCYFDFDGDGYEEPYIVTFDLASAKVHQITNRFRHTHTEQSLKTISLSKSIALAKQPAQIEMLQKQLVELRQQKPKVVKIEPNEHFTKYAFIPSPDGGIYDLGFGVLLGPLNRAVDTLINELVDSGKLQNQNSGFIGKGAKIPGGRLRFSFGEWKKVDVAGATLRESIVPLPVSPPSPVLFDLLGVLISYGEKTASVTEAMTGDNPGQNTPAYGWQQMLTQGMAVYSGIFKRVFRAMRSEFRIRYKLNAIYLNPQEYFSISDGKDQKIFQSDYLGDPKDIRPTADPNTVVSEDKTRKIAMIAERAAKQPGYNKPKVERLLLESMQIEDPDELFPLDDKGQPKIKLPPPPDFQLKAMEEQRKTLEADNQKAKDQADTKIASALAEADIELKQAQIVKIYAEAGAIDVKSMTEQLTAQTNRMNVQRQSMKDLGELIGKEKDRKDAASNKGNGGAMGGSSGNGVNQDYSG